jgi:hypothetical protein
VKIARRAARAGLDPTIIVDVNPSSSTQSDVEPSPAATVVVLRDGPSAPEILMVRRHDRSSFMAGAHVFPGGRVDATDEGWHEDPLCEESVRH